MLPGLADLRGNARNNGAVTVFSTGPTLAVSRISGTLFNWAEGRTIPRGLIEARPVNDTTTVYVTVTDSIGDFILRNIPNERYRVRGFSDDNSNRGIDPREPFDTVITTVADSARVELLAFVHDSVGTRLSAIVAKDSVTLDLVFDNPLSVTNLPTPASVRVRNAADSTDVIAVVSVGPMPADTATSEAKPPAGAPSPTTSRSLPVAAELPVRKPSKPAPLRSLEVKLARPLRPRVNYHVRVTDVQNLVGVAKTSERDVALPLPPAPAPAGAVPPPSPPAPTPVKK
jgi:hypothetical protein